MKISTYLDLIVFGRVKLVKTFKFIRLLTRISNEYILTLNFKKSVFMPI